MPSESSCTHGMRDQLVAIPLDRDGNVRDQIRWTQTGSTPDTPCPVVWNDCLFAARTMA